MKYILASASPRRKELLERTGIDFEIIPSHKEEKIDGNDPSEIVKNLALMKAQDIFDQHEEDSLTVIGSDTIVVYRDEILGKPSDEDEAADMLSMLSDRTHQVYTGVAILTREKGIENKNVFFESTDVTFYPISKEDIESYIATGDPLDKAGSYGIQGDFCIHVKCIKGDYNNVVGLPVSRVYQELKKTLAPKCKRLVFE